jgi:hypothetical protein
VGRCHAGLEEFSELSKIRNWWAGCESNALIKITGCPLSLLRVETEVMDLNYNKKDPT